MPTIDAAFRSYVKGTFDTDGNGKLSPAEISLVTYIDVCDMGISSLKGVEYFTKLLHMYCDYNNLTSLGVSKNTAFTNNTGVTVTVV